MKNANKKFKCVNCRKLNFRGSQVYTKDGYLVKTCKSKDCMKVASYSRLYVFQGPKTLTQKNAG